MMDYEEKPFTDFGQFGVGKLDLRVFNQGQYWVDVQGREHLIEEMSEDYRRNVIIHLLTSARFFHSGLVKEQLIVGLCQAFGYEIESSFEPNIYEQEALSWLEETPLMATLRALTPNSPTLDPEILFS